MTETDYFMAAIVILFIFSDRFLLRLFPLAMLTLPVFVFYPMYGDYMMGTIISIAGLWAGSDVYGNINLRNKSETF